MCSPCIALFSSFSLCTTMTRWSIPNAFYDALIDHPELSELHSIQVITKLKKLPWDESDPIALWLEENTLPAIISFNRYYKNQGAEARRRTLVQRSQVFKQDGRDAVLAHLRDVVRRWNIRPKILACLSARGVGPYDIMKTMQSRSVSLRSAHSTQTVPYSYHHQQLPDIHRVGLDVHHGGIAVALFGEEAVFGNPPYFTPSPKLNRFIARSVVYTWHIEKTRISRECSRLDKEVQDAHQKYDGERGLSGA